MSTTNYTLRKAATVVVVRDGEKGLEILLLKRSDQLEFAPGNWVFPGGSVDPQDAEGSAEEMDTLQAAAVREAKEETGADLYTEDLTYFLQFTTPGGKKRFETWFFVAPIRHSTADITPDGSEIVEHRWIDPAEAVNAFEQGNMPIFVPTGLTLMRLSFYNSVEDLIRAFQAAPPVKILPFVVKDGDDMISLYPGDIAYEDKNWEQPGPRHRSRISLKTGAWFYQHTADEEQYPRLDGGYNRNKYEL